MEIITRAVGAIGGEWAVQTFDDYDGYLTILVEPSSQTTERKPTYMVSGTTARMELAAVDGDDCQTVGRFGEIYGLAAELTSRLRGVTSNAA